MNFKINGEIDIERILKKRTKEEKAIELAHQIIERNLKIEKISMEYKIYENSSRCYFYDYYNPTMQLLCHKESSLEEINKIFIKSFEKLNADEYPLTIIDPYLFAEGTDTNFLIELLINNVKSKKVTFMTARRNTNEEILNEIINALESQDFEVRNYFERNLHDRVWFTEKGGFVCGTSINGLGKKNFTVFINLDDEDLRYFNLVYNFY